jgi:small subunit ribosomal protein S17
MAERKVDNSTETRGRAKAREGIVVSNKMQKTVVVAVERQVKHGTYGKYVRKTSKYYAHDEANGCGVGDRVRIVETRPLSKLKRWKIAEVIRKAEIAG